MKQKIGYYVRNKGKHSEQVSHHNFYFVVLLVFWGNATLILQRKDTAHSS